MSDTTRLDQIDEEILSYEVSDEALETAAGTGEEKDGNYTLGVFSGLVFCPVSRLSWSWLLNFVPDRQIDRVKNEAPDITAPRSFPFYLDAPPACCCSTRQV